MDLQTNWGNCTETRLIVSVIRMAYKRAESASQFQFLSLAITNNYFYNERTVFQTCLSEPFLLMASQLYSNTGLCRTLCSDSVFATSCFIFWWNVLRISVCKLKFIGFPISLLCITGTLSQWEGVPSGYVAVFVSSYQDYLIIIIILEVFGVAMALPNRQCKRYPVSTSRSAPILKKIR